MKVVERGVKVGGAVVALVGPAIVYISDKARDHREYIRSLPTVPDVTGIDILKAEEIVKSNSLIPVRVLANPTKEYVHKPIGQVIKTRPRAKSKAEEKSVVKIYYIDESIMARCIELKDLYLKKKEEARLAYEQKKRELVGKIPKKKQEYLEVFD
jgi:beta-lactam-binding protein with PASTA domain